MVAPLVEAGHEAAVVELMLQLGLVVVTVAHPAEHLHDADEDEQVEDADDPQERPRHGRPDQAGRRMQPRAVVGDRAAESLDPEVNASASRKTMLEWPREKKKPTLSGRWPSAISLRVVLSIAPM